MVNNLKSRKRSGKFHDISEKFDIPSKKYEYDIYLQKKNQNQNDTKNLNDKNENIKRRNINSSQENNLTNEPTGKKLRYRDSTIDYCNEDRKEEKNKNIGSRLSRRFNRFDSNELKIIKEKDEDKSRIKIDETDTSYSNDICESSGNNKKNFTRGRLVNDSNDKLIKLENDEILNKKEKYKEREEKPKVEDNGRNNELRKERRFRRFFRSADYLPKKDQETKKEESKPENIWKYRNQRNSLDTKIVPGSRNEPKELLDKKNIELENEKKSIRELPQKEDSNKNKNDQDYKMMRRRRLLNKNISNSNINEKENVDENKLDKDKNESESKFNKKRKYYRRYLSQEKEINEKKDKEIDDKINHLNNKRYNNIKNKSSDNKYNEYTILDNLFNEVEQKNVKKLLKGNLSEIYEDLIKTNLDFKNNVFFVNLNHFEDEVGECDSKIIPHSFKRIQNDEILNHLFLLRLNKEIMSSQELLRKYIEKSKMIKKENEF